MHTDVKCTMKSTDNKAICVIIKVRMGLLAKKELLGLAALESSSLGLPHKRWFHSHCMPVAFLLLGALVQVLKSVLIILCIRGSVRVAYPSRIWISLRYSKDEDRLQTQSCVYIYIYVLKNPITALWYLLSYCVSNPAGMPPEGRY